MKVGRLAERRRGLITVEWLNEAGLSASQKTALVESGYLEQVTPGVYKVVGAPSTRFTEILALWMRLGDNDYQSDPPVLVAAGATAAYLHDIGDMWPDPYDFITSRPLRAALKKRLATLHTPPRQFGVPEDWRRRFGSRKLRTPLVDPSDYDGAVRDATELSAAVLDESVSDDAVWTPEQRWTLSPGGSG